MSPEKSKPVTRNATSKGVMPVRRDVKFPLPPDRVHDWADGNVQFTHLMNTMSLVIPVGERFFIDTLRHYRDRVQDPELKRAVTAFIGQEAMHGREHDEYNARIFERLPEAAAFERSIKALLDTLKARMPASTRLSTTIALEHLNRFENFAIRHGRDTTYGELANAIEPLNRARGAAIIQGLTVQRRVEIDLRVKLSHATPLQIH